jgi:hypothetical protein
MAAELVLLSLVERDEFLSLHNVPIGVLSFVISQAT